MDISVIVPLYNEEESLPELHAWIKRVMDANGFSYEIIFVNDGSTDGSWKVIESLSKDNKEVKEIKFRRNYGKSPALFCGFERAEGDVVIPDGSFVPQVGDRLYLIGQPTGLTAFFRLLGRHNPRCRNVFLVGGGRIAHYLTAILERLGIHVKIIERSLDRCRHLSEVLPKATVICGDGTDQELLEEEDVTASDAFVALTDRDEDNLIISLYAMQQGIPKVVAKSNRQNYAGIAHAAGLDSVISPKLITAGQILQVVRGMQNSKGSVMNALYKIADGHAEAMEFVANETTRYQGVPLKELKLKKGILIAVLVHDGRIIIPDGSAVISAGDTVIIVSRSHGILDINDIYDDALLDLGGVQ